MPGYELIDEAERDAVNDVFDHGGVLFRQSFDNLRQNTFKVREFEAAFASRMGVEHALAVTSGTAALRVALAALGIGPGDEVVTQSFTFVATVEAIIESGATPVICEIDGTLNMDPTHLKQVISQRTKAVIAVHMLGVPARLDAIGAVVRDAGIPLIEDTAWGCGGSFGGKPLGTHGAIGTYSFDFAKTMTTGEGGMLVFQDARTAERARAWHDHGHENNPALPRWEDSRSGSGFNYRMMELQGAVGLAQLAKLDRVVEAQRANCHLMREALEGIPGLSFRETADGSMETADALVFFVPDAPAASRCRKALLDAGVGTKILPEAITWHFAGAWNHMPSLVRSHGGDLSRAFPVSLGWLERAVALPIFVRMPEDLPTRTCVALRRVLD